MVVPAYSRLKCGEMSRGLDADSGDLQSQEHKEAETVDAREGLRRGISGLLLQSKWLMDHGGALIDGCKENPMCYRRPLQQGSRATDRFQLDPRLDMKEAAETVSPKAFQGIAPARLGQRPVYPGRERLRRVGRSA